MLARQSKNLEQARRLELGLVRVRWFAVVLGLYLVSQTNLGPPPRASHSVVVGAYAIMAGLAAGNVLIWIGAVKLSSLSALRRLGLAAFLFDAALIFGAAWIYSYDPKGSTWVVIYILPLEGALRYQLEGAIASVLLSLANELGREAYLAHRFAHPVISGGAFIDRYPFLISNVAFRVGVEGIIALVGGFMARSLAREAEKAEEQARRSDEAARREAAARRELAAFNTAILTGVAAEDLDSSLRLMADAIGRDLGYESFSILLREGDELAVKGMYGMPFYEDRIPLGRGVTGTVAATRQGITVPDVSAFPGYIVVDAEMRSEMAAPMKIGEEVIGVLDVESRVPGAFDDGALDLLIRLADQIALVAHANRLLSQQTETVKRLQELDQMKSDFVAITSHELRTPITAIRGFIKTLIRSRRRFSDEQVMTFMQIIDRQSSRLARLVEDLLFVAKIEAGTVRVAREEVDVHRFLKEVVDSQTLEGRSRVWLDVRPDVDFAVIDPQRVEQVVRNLIDNALKFSPQDSQVFLEADMDHGTLSISVTDHGVGIAEAELPYIFERFHQAGEVLTREAEGAGLGLYISKRLVEAMGGTIEVRSSPGEGSTFTVTLPPVEARPETRPEPAEVDPKETAEQAS
jgi:signal transduction histidine kinase